MKEYVWDYLPEILNALPERLIQAESRWGNLWQLSSKEGLLARIKHHIDAELLAYQTTGNTDRLLDVIGYATILYIREVLEKD